MPLNLLQETSDVQGLLISGYRHLLHTAYLFLEITEPAAARKWLGALDVTSAKYDEEASGEKRKPACAVNIAFTLSGLLKLGYPSSAIERFPEEFQQGLAEPSRSRRLGDEGPNSPLNWEIGGVTADWKLKEPIHALLIVQARPEDIKGLLDSKHGDLKAAKLRVIHTEKGYRERLQHEHFGFLDGISQPHIKDSPKPRPDAQIDSATGEFILGYENSYELLPPTPYVEAVADPADILPPVQFAVESGAAPKDFGCNGTYLVFRKLEQDVAAFRQYFSAKFPSPADRELMQAKFVGRWPSGAPLALAPVQDDPSLTEPPASNDFGYAMPDPHGLGCPIGSHVRRSNPRDSFADTPAVSLVQVGRHRIIRRGNAYGDRLGPERTEDDGVKRGLLFVCLNADLNRQFEFLQQSWIVNPKFNGLYNDRDPLIGPNADPTTMTVQREPVRLRITDVPQFVTVKGGAYFFMPGLRAIRFLASL